jgi:hypothetical protein
MGGSYNLAAGMKMKWQMNMGERWWATNKATMKLNSNTSVTIGDRVDVKNLFTDPKNANYTWGLGLEFNM